MLKASQIDVGHLVALIENSSVKPEWYMMQLPGGKLCQSPPWTSIPGPFSTLPNQISHRAEYASVYARMGDYED